MILPSYAVTKLSGGQLAVLRVSSNHGANEIGLSIMGIGRMNIPLAADLTGLVAHGRYHSG